MGAPGWGPRAAFPASDLLFTSDNSGDGEDGHEGQMQKSTPAPRQLGLAPNRHIFK